MAEALEAAVSLGVGGPASFNRDKLKLIGRGYHAWDVLARFEELEYELLRVLLVAPALHQTALSRAG